MKRSLSILAFSIFAATGTAMAAQSAATTASGLQAAASTALTEGEVRKIDKETKKLTIRHGPIQNLDMPPMTMVFQVSDPALLDKVKPGDKIKFSADKVAGAFTVTHVETAQ